MPIKAVFFDALYTIVKPRLPIKEQYALVFSPYFNVPSERIKPSFKAALRGVQIERPAYSAAAGDINNEKSEAWWREVIRRTAIGAGAESEVVAESLPMLVPTLMKRFSSSEGYVLYDDAYSTITALRNRNIVTGLVSNTDSRMRMVLEDLKIMAFLSPALFSEEEGIEKPAPQIWERALRQASVNADEALHIGDEVEADFRGAKAAGLSALLIQREEEEEEDVDIPVEIRKSGGMIFSLTDVIGFVDKANKNNK